MFKIIWFPIYTIAAGLFATARDIWDDQKCRFVPQHRRTRELCMQRYPANGGVNQNYRWKEEVAEAAKNLGYH